MELTIILLLFMAIAATCVALAVQELRRKHEAYALFPIAIPISWTCLAWYVVFTAALAIAGPSGDAGLAYAFLFQLTMLPVSCVGAVAALGPAREGARSTQVQLAVHIGVAVLAAYAMHATDDRSRREPPPPLVEAVRRDDAVQLQALVSAGADVNIAYRNSTPLTIAASRGAPGMVRILLEAGADPNHPNNKYALTAAIRHGHIEVVRLLIAQGAALNDQYYPPPLFDALDNRDSLEIVMLLIENGADVNAVHLNRTALMDAIDGTELAKQLREEGATEPLITELINSGADVNFISRLCKSALTEARQSGRSDIEAMLVRHGADLTRLASCMEQRERPFRYPHRELNTQGETIAELSTDDAERVLGGSRVLVHAMYECDCKPMAQLQAALGAITAPYIGELRIIELDIERNDTFARKHQIRSTPTLLLIDNGVVLSRLEGFESQAVTEAWLAGAMR